MALHPDTPEEREVRTAGNTLRQRRLIRGVGAQERALGNAWAGMSSWEKERFGSQRNFSRELKTRAVDIESTRLQKRDAAAKQAGRDSVLGTQETQGDQLQARRKATLGIPATPLPTGAGTAVGSTIGQAVATAATNSTTPAARPKAQPTSLVEHMGRQYPANLVADPAKRTSYDREIDTRLTQESQRRNGYNPDPEAALAARRKQMVDEMRSSNPGKYQRMKQAETANGGNLPKGWQDQPDMEDAVNSGRVRMS